MEHFKIEGRARVYGLRLLLLGYFWPKSLKSVGVRMFTENSTNHTFKDEGLPYGPTWTTEKIREHLKKPVFEDSSYGAFETTSAFACISEQEIQDWQAVMSPYRVTIVANKWTNSEGYGFHSYIFLDQDKLEIDNFIKRKTEEAKNELLRCQICYNISDNEKLTLYPGLGCICACVEAYEHPIRVNMEPGVVTPSAYELNLKRNSQNSQNSENFENSENSENSASTENSKSFTGHIDVRLYSDEPIKDAKYSPTFFLQIERNSHIEEDQYEEFVRPAKIQAVINGDVEELKRLFKQVPYLGPVGHKGRTPLCVACERGDMKMVNCVLKLGAVVDEQASTGWTPLLLALDNGHTEIVELLLARDASIQFSEQALDQNIDKSTISPNLREKLTKLKKK